MSKNGLKAITFDLWNTLIQDADGTGRTRASRRIDATWSALKGGGFEISKQQVREAYSAAQDRYEEIRRQGRDTAFEAQIDGFLEMIEEGLSGRLSATTRDGIVRGHLNAYLEYPPVLMPGALEVLKAVRAGGYRTGLICNSGSTPGDLQRKFLAEKGIAQYMEVLTFSDEERVAKPSPGIFLKTLKALDTGPQEALHIGDTPEADILGAKRLGMRAVLIGSASLDGLPVAPDARIWSLSELPAVLDGL